MLNIPRKVRAAIYLFVLFGSPVVVYLTAVGLFGPLEAALWTSLSGIAAGIAQLNLTPKE